MAIDVNAIEQTVEVTAVGDEVNVNIIDQPVLVSVTDQIIEVEASGGTGPQGPAGAGVAAGGTTGQVLSKASNTNYDTVWVDAGAGTVYSVDASGSTGISVTGGPITGAGTLTITNTAPDQVVSLTGAGTAVITGTYPNFTITTNDEFDGTVTSVNLTAGTGISVSGGPITSSGAINVVNTAPDQVVSLTGGGTTTISGTYPNFTISSADQYSGTVTSVNMTVPTGLTISGNPITSAGTLALALASGYSIPTTASQANWDSAYNDKINSASVTGTSTKTLTLNQQDGGTVTASWSDTDTGLTSVGLSMPSAFSVANSPLTSNGTLAVTGAGTSAQYVRGDGQLANFPTTGGGGSSVNYYLNGSINQGTFGGDTYYEMSKSPIIGAGTDFTRTNAQGNGYIASFITDAGDPGLLNIPGGNWNLEFYFEASSGGGNPAFYGEIYKVSSSNVFTLIASGSTNPEVISGGTIIDQYFTSIAIAQTSLLATDRLAIRIYVIPDGRDITLHTENSNLCEILTTFSTGLNALNGLTEQVQYFATGTSGTDFNIQSLTDTHTFNLPVASGSNTGKLSNIDWLTFDGKENVLTFSAPLSRSVNTVSIPVANASQPGYLDSTDWTTFNAKVTSVSATSPLFSTGGKTPTLTIQQASGSQNGYLSSTDWSTFNNKQNAITLTTTGASGASTFIGSTLNIPTYTLTGLGGVPTTRQLTINGTAYDLSADRSWTIPVHDAVTIGTANGLSLSTQVLSLGLSSSSTNGALSSTDWSTFNSKQNAITLTTTGSSGSSTLVGSTLNVPTYTLSGLGGVPTTRTLTINGTAYDLSADRTWNVGTVTSATATTGGQVAFFNGATVITSVSGLYFDGVDKLGIGNSSPAYNLDVTGTARMTGNLTAASIIKSGGTSTQYLMADGSTSTLTNPVTGTGTTNYLPKWTSGSAIGNSLVYDDGTNVGIGTSTPIFKLQIYDAAGTSMVVGAATGKTYVYGDDAGGTIGTISAIPLRFSTNSVERARITTGGNVLINSTTDNGNLLQVNGDGYFSGSVAIGTSTANFPLTINRGSSYTLGLLNSNIGTVGQYIGLTFGYAGTSYLKGAIYFVSRDSAGRGNLQFALEPSLDSSNVSTSNTKMTLNYEGNLGLGVVPSAWSAGKAIQVDSVAVSLWGVGNQTALMNNAYYNSGDKYAVNGEASYYLQASGSHKWFTAPSGTAGNAITFTQAMTLTSDGNLLVGTSVDGGYKLTVAGVINTTNTTAYLLRDGTTTGYGIYKNSATEIAIAANGNVALNITSTGAATFSSSVTAGTPYVSFDSFNARGKIFLDDSTRRYVTLGMDSNVATINCDWYSGAGGASPDFAIKTNATERMRITSGGNLLVGTTTDSGERLQVNGSGYFSSTVTLGGGSRIAAVAGNGLNLNAGSADRLTIKSNGSVRYIPMATPGTAEAGDVYYDSTSNKLRCYNGTSWNDLF